MKKSCRILFSFLALTMVTSLNAWAGFDASSDNGSDLIRRRPIPFRDAAPQQLTYDFAPVFAFDLDFGNKMINQTLGSNPNAVTIDQDSSGGFKVVQSQHLELGAGFTQYWHYINSDTAKSLFATGFGVLPIVGSNVIATRYVGTQSDAAQLPAIVPPYSATDINSWSINDSMTFQSSGGILFFGGVGWAGLGTGPSYLAKGVWTTYVEKTGANTAYVKITKSNLQSLGVVAGSLVTGVSVDTFADSDSAFSYTFDLSDPTASAAYEDFMRGNVATTQKLAADAVKGQGTVQLDSSSRATSVGHMSHFWFGIPMLLETQWGSGKIYTYKDTFYHADGSETQAQYGVYVREKTSHVLFHERGKRASAFIATAATNISSNGATADTQSAQFVWQYENSNSSSKDLTKAIAQLIKDTGLRQDLSVTVPQASNLGYAEINMTMTIPQNTTNYLVNMAAFPNVLQALEQNAVDAAKNYFAEGDADAICSNDRPEDIANCQADVEADTLGATKNMAKQLTVMSQALQSADWASYAKAYSQVGKDMTKNQFTLQATLTATQSVSPQISYTIQGAKIAVFKREIVQP